MEATIRDAALDDASEISALVTRVALETFFAHGPEDGRSYFLAMNTPAAIAGKMRGNYRYHVAELDDRVVGMIAMLNNTHLYHLFIDSAHAGHGIGRRLWEHARRVCERHGNPGHFTVNSTPDAVGIYERFGFVATGGLETRNGLTAQPMRLGPAPRPG
jgi:GNAT superfamily N-acetyltransferase